MPDQSYKVRDIISINNLEGQAPHACNAAVRRIKLVDPEPFFKALVGKKVSLVWRGYGSAIFIEFGRLTPHKLINGRDGTPVGEVTLTIEWGWRIERKLSILGGSWSSEGKWPGFFKKLTGASVISVETFGKLPEISVSLSNGLRIVSFNTSEGQPDWALLTRNPFIGHLCVERGRLKIDHRNS